MVNMVVNYYTVKLTILLCDIVVKFTIDVKVISLPRRGNLIYSQPQTVLVYLGDGMPSAMEFPRMHCKAPAPPVISGNRD